MPRSVKRSRSIEAEKEATSTRAAAEAVEGGVKESRLEVDNLKGRGLKEDIEKVIDRVPKHSTIDKEGGPEHMMHRATMCVWELR